MSAYTLDLSGVPTATLTLFSALRGRGHQVLVYSPFGGTLATNLDAYCTIPDCDPDIILAQHNACAVQLRQKFPTVPMIFYTHHPEYEGEQPPPFECEWYFAINEDTATNFINKGVPAEKVSIVRDFIDTDRYNIIKPVNNTLTNVLYVSNRKKWRTYDIIKKACDILKVNFKAVGSPYGRARSIEKDINDADLVIGWARCLLEAMSCGRPVISYDKEVGDGYIDYNTYLKGRVRNFGVTCEHKFTFKELVNEMKKYNPKDGIVNREIILSEHNVERIVDQMIFHFNRLI